MAAAAERAGGSIAHRTETVAANLEAAFAALGQGFETGAASAVQSLRGTVEGLSGEIDGRPAGAVAAPPRGARAAARRAGAAAKPYERAGRAWWTAAPWRGSGRWRL
ncbi:hypothetical protein CCS92_34685 [Methylobacterium radiotolerans]|nr:hypothetical protein CCS92_34685 [Methylobacterium radiotolerans]